MYTKNNYLKKIGVAVCMVVLLVLLFAVIVSAEVYGGNCGKDVTWSFDNDTGVLAIDGNGAMENWQHQDDVPWCVYSEDIQTVTIGENVKRVGKYAFYGCDNLKEITTTSPNTSFYGSKYTVGDSVVIYGYGDSEAKNYSDKYNKVFVPFSISGVCGENLEWELNMLTGVLNITGKGNMPNWASHVDVPWYFYRGHIKEVNIGDEVTSIGNLAFKQCAGLTEITIPESVTTICYQAFFGCSFLERIEIPDSVTELGNQVFYNCSNLVDVKIGNGVPQIGNQVFYRCNNLTSITLGSNVGSIGSNAFFGCDKLVEIVNNSKVAINKGSTNNGQIAKNALDVHSGNSNAVNLDGYIFYTCGGKNYLVNYVGDEQILVLPEDYNGESYVINKYAFSSNDGNSIISIVIPDAVSAIGNMAFSGCYKLVEVIDRSSLGIQRGSLANGRIGCYALDVHDGESKIAESGDFLFYTYGDTNILLGYTGDSPKLVLPDTYNGKSYRIYSFAFCNNKNLVSVVLPKSVRSIERGTFYNCSNLKSVEIPNGVVFIGDKAFAYCSSLISLKIPDSVTTIGSSAFRYCTDLKYIDLSDSLRNIYPCTFLYCSNLSSIKIPGKIKNIGNFAFQFCSNLKDVTIPQSVEILGAGAFEYCHNLNVITFLSGNTRIMGLENTIHNTAVLCSHSNSTAEEYAENFNREFLLIGDTHEIVDNITVIEFEAIYTPTHETSEIIPMVSLKKGEDECVFIYLETSKGVLMIKNSDGEYVPLCEKDKKEIKLKDKKPTEIAIVYDDMTGIARYYVDKHVPHHNDNNTVKAANAIHVYSNFNHGNEKGIVVTLDGVVSKERHYNIGRSGTSEILAFQSKEDSRAIRILAGVDMPWYEDIGYEVTTYINGVAKSTKYLKSKIIYSTVIADNKEIYAKDYGYNYFSVLEISKVNVKPGEECCILVRPYTQVANDQYFGSSAKIDVTGSGYSFDEKYKEYDVINNASMFSLSENRVVDGDGIQFNTDGATLEFNSWCSGEIYLNVDVSKNKSKEKTANFNVYVDGELVNELRLDIGKNNVCIANVESGNHTVKIKRINGENATVKSVAFFNDHVHTIPREAIWRMTEEGNFTAICSACDKKVTLYESDREMFALSFDEDIETQAKQYSGFTVVKPSNYKIIEDEDGKLFDAENTAKYIDVDRTVLADTPFYCISFDLTISKNGNLNSETSIFSIVSDFENGSMVKSTAWGYFFKYNSNEGKLSTVAAGNDPSKLTPSNSIPIELGRKYKVIAAVNTAQRRAYVFVDGTYLGGTTALLPDVINDTNCKPSLRFNDNASCYPRFDNFKITELK